MGLDLTEKGKVAFDYARQFFPSGYFSAKDLSDKCGEKIVAATLNGIVNKGYMQKDTEHSPVMFSFVDEIDVFLELLEQENTGCDNSNLGRAKEVKNDEFYTRLDDVNAEVMQYKKYFKGKSVFCNCNDGLESQFFQFFLSSFDHFQLTRLVGISYNKDGHGIKYEVSDDLNGDGFIDERDIIVTHLNGTGGFDTDESIEELKKSDIVCTNPPFSVFRAYVNLLLEHQKQFLIIGNKNAITYKEFFPLLKNNLVWIGVTTPNEFITPDGTQTKKVNGLTRWFTNIPHTKRNEPLVLTASYYDSKNKREDYPVYDNYDAIEVGKVVNIPKDYTGVMGVPITFMDKYCPDQFEILGCSAYSDPDYLGTGSFYAQGQKKYARITIRSKQ